MRGVVKAGEIVHHKVELTPENINNPDVALSFDNLVLVCRDCHAELHDAGKKDRRYMVGQDGEVVVCDT